MATGYDFDHESGMRRRCVSCNGGSHPHLVHNFLMACTGERPAMPDAETSVNWTMVGICAHDSALKGGDKITLPRF